MNQHTTISSPSSKPRLAWIQYFIAVLLLLALLLLWRELALTQKSLAEVLEKNSTLAGNLESTNEELVQLKSGDSSPQARERLEAARKEKSAEPIEEPETLFLKPPTVSQTEGGLAALLAFETALSEPPDLIALVIRIPGDTAAQILGLKPASESTYANEKVRVDASGKFAVFQGTPADLKALQFELIVSEPTKAMVRGSKGIKPFEIEIFRDTAVTRQL